MAKCLSCMKAIIAILFIMASSTHIAHAEQVIRAYTSHIEVMSDGSANVQEEIVYDFGGEQLHGIYRTIPLSIRPLGKVEYASLDISSIAVTDGRGNRLQAQYDKGGNSITLTIGDPDKTITGPQLFVIHYVLKGAVVANLANDEFNWDSIGNNWQVTIDRLRTEILFPVDIPMEKISSHCSLTYDNGKSSSCSKNIVSSSSTPKGALIRFEATSTPPHTQFLVQSTFPKGSIVYRSQRDNNMQITKSQKGIVKWWNQPFIDLSLIVPFIIFFSMLTLRIGHTQVYSSSFITASQSYILTGIALILFSFYISGYNLATLLSGVIITIFGVIPMKKV